MTDLVLTLIGPDRPGIVEAVAEAVAGHGGNWLESRMAHLAGRFAGVLRIEVDAGRVEQLEAALKALEGSGLRLVLERSGPPAGGKLRAVEIELLGLDRPGLVRQIAELLADRGANVEELRTDRFSAPMSGELLFRAQLRVNVPEELPVARLRGDLEQLAADLMVELRLAEALGTARSAG
jgi:glycine cleavage system regulatory protein